MEILVIAAILGLIPAYIAKGKGRSMATWWVYGTLLFIIALPHSIFMGNEQNGSHRPCGNPECSRFLSASQTECWCGWQTPLPSDQTSHEPEVSQTDERDCPFCAEPIKKKATKCKHCGSEVRAT